MMRQLPGLRIRLLALAVAVPSASVARPLLAQRASAFVPAVTVADSIATCESQSSAVLGPDERGFALRYGPAAAGPARRVVSAVWDTTGHLRRYSDARGDLRGPPVPVAERGDRTTIMIDFTKGTALMLNESHGRSFGSGLTTPGDALAADNLGPPRQLLERLHTQCGAPAP
jgi:hypothetical protein